MPKESTRTFSFTEDEIAVLLLCLRDRLERTCKLLAGQRPSQHVMDFIRVNEMCRVKLLMGEQLA